MLTVYKLRGECPRCNQPRWGIDRLDCAGEHGHPVDAVGNQVEETSEENPDCHCSICASHQTFIPFMH